MNHSSTMASSKAKTAGNVGFMRASHEVHAKMNGKLLQPMTTAVEATRTQTPAAATNGGPITRRADA
jgi:hypothetical protein